MASAEPKRVPIPRYGVDYRGKVVLAPMVRSGELPSRLLALKYGADLVWGPETIDRAIIGTTRRLNPLTNTIEYSRLPSSKLANPGLDPANRESVIYRIHPALEHGRLIYQLGTSSPTLAVEAAKLVASDVAGIDVNAGCPKSFSTAGGMGAALLKTPDLLCEILSKLVEEVGRVWEIGISVKIRLLERAEDTEALVRRLVGTGITGLTVHCRTTPMRPRERAIREQLGMVGDVCREAGVACVMNGDVTSRAQALTLIKKYNVDAAMIATAAEKNPSVFRAEEEGGLVEGKTAWREIVKEYLWLALEVENRWGNTKYLLGQMVPGKEKCYAEMNRSKCYQDFIRVFGFEDVDGMMEMAKAVDDRLGIPHVAEPKVGKRARVKELAPAEPPAKTEAEDMPAEGDVKRIKVPHLAMDMSTMVPEVAPGAALSV
ncbi:FMN-linked oxidoreductase [Lepidopterella palustris CBS 459.81]|uniref:FMN-linked oxidoreductase n=1 Tax=Lepidopterella palustris CBS 459.81 TaxID=1314670 RepID=A0A8E2JG21_9PEZI|nr:FMN-linked oxidoreductase [Lepidopterella palustris CBS 459.81]